MERDFYNEDIEQLLKQKADQYKMYPSDKVWKGIHRSLHSRRKWYWFSFVLFLGAISYYTIMDMIAPPRHATMADANNSTSQATASGQKDKQAVVIPFVTDKHQATKGNAAARKITVPFTDEQPAIGNAISLAPTDADAENIEVAPSREALVFDFRTGKLKDDLLKAVPAERMNVAPATSSSGNHHVDAPDADPAVHINWEKADDNINSEDAQRINWLQQNAVYELPVQKAQRLSWQLSFSPTMNYRKLAGTDYTRVHSDVKNVPIAPNIVGTPEELVRHKPALGLEIGSHFIYSLNKTFAVRAGLQFNYSRYDIQAYSSYTTERATIALNRNSSIMPDSLTSYTNLRNFGGDNVQDLRNQYFQFSIPVGIEWRLLGNDKLQLGVAGTVQPTYLINRNTYLITTDFKNYTQEPSLLRRWNLNGSAEAFIAYKTGDLKWQVGPQFRYQLLSSYIREYPISEHLMEFGIKIGVAKTIR